MKRFEFPKSAVTTGNVNETTQVTETGDLSKGALESATQLWNDFNKRLGARVDNGSLWFFWKNIDEEETLTQHNRLFDHPNDQFIQHREDEEQVIKSELIPRVNDEADVENFMKKGLSITRFKGVLFTDRHITGLDRNHQQTVPGYEILRKVERVMLGNPALLNISNLLNEHPRLPQNGKSEYNDDTSLFIKGLVDNVLSKSDGVQRQISLTLYLNDFADNPAIDKSYRSVLRAELYKHSMDILSNQDLVINSSFVLSEYAKYREGIMFENKDYSIYASRVPESDRGQYPNGRDILPNPVSPTSDDNLLRLDLTSERVKDRWAMMDFKEWWFRAGQWRVREEIYNVVQKDISENLVDKQNTNVFINGGDIASDTGTVQDHIKGLKEAIKIVEGWDSEEKWILNLSGNHDMDPREPEVIPYLLSIYGKQIGYQEVSSGEDSSESESVLTIVANDFHMSRNTWDKVFNKAILSLPLEQRQPIIDEVNRIKQMQERVLKKAQEYKGEVVVLTHNPRRFIDDCGFDISKTNISHIIGGHVHSNGDVEIVDNLNGKPIQVINGSTYPGFSRDGIIVSNMGSALDIDIDPTRPVGEKVKVTVLRPDADRVQQTLPWLRVKNS